MLNQDLDNVFFNDKEFADWHDVEGKRILLVTDSDGLLELKASLDLAESQLMIMAKVEDLPPRRPPGQALNVDGREYTVDNWSVNLGVATVILSHPDVI